MNAADALLLGIDKERSSYSFYKSASEICRDPSGERLFEVLANVELGHVRYLESLYSGLTSDGNWQLSNIEEIPKCPVDLEHPGLFPCAPAEEQKCLTVEDDLQILNDAIGREQEARDFYKDLCHKIDDSTGRAVFEYLVEQEQDHERMLAEARDHLQRTGSWHKPAV